MLYHSAIGDLWENDVVFNNVAYQVSLVFQRCSTINDCKGWFFVKTGVFNDVKSVANKRTIFLLYKNLFHKNAEVEIN